MISLFFMAAAFQLSVLHSGDATLAQPSTTISDQARGVLAAGGNVYCKRIAQPTGSKLACLTTTEWSDVARDATKIEKQWAYLDRRYDTALELELFRGRSSIR